MVESELHGEGVSYLDHFGTLTRMGVIVNFSVLSSE